MILIFISALLALASSLIDGSRCHSVVNNRLIYLKPLQHMYRVSDDDSIYLFSLCAPFTFPPYNCPASFSMVINDNNCTRYSSGQLTTGYKISLLDETPSGIRIEETSDQVLPGNAQPLRTSIQIVCDQSEDSLKIEEVYVDELTLYVESRSVYGCAAIDINRMWSVLSEYTFIYGIILILVGILELFFGRMLLKPTIFIAAYGLSFISLGLLLFDMTVGPQTNQIYIYFCLLALVLGCCCMGYFCMSISNISVSLVGAWMGFILALLLNSAIDFSHNALTILTVTFCILFGLLTYRYSDQVVIVSTALTGSYLIVRPFSWIFGGFPNQLIDTIHTQPTFFVYLSVIIILTMVGCTYQFLKLRRQTEPATEATGLEQQIEVRVDRLKNVVDGIIQKYMTQERPMEQMQLPMINHQYLKTPVNGPIVRREDSQKDSPPMKIQGQVIRFSKQ